MKILEGMIQGSDAWHAYRRTARNASEAASVMGESKYQKRDELLREKTTGIDPEISPEQQARYDRGH
jgi:predicted phage-related endonuclease